MTIFIFVFLYSLLVLLPQIENKTTSIFIITIEVFTFNNSVFYMLLNVFSVAQDPKRTHLVYVILYVIYISSYLCVLWKEKQIYIAWSVIFDTLVRTKNIAHSQK